MSVPHVSAAIDSHESGDVECGTHNRELSQLRLVQDLEPRVQGLEEHGRIHVALVVGAVHDGGCGHMLATTDPPPDPGQRQGQTHAPVPQLV